MLRIALLLALVVAIVVAQTGPLTDEQIVNLHKGGLNDEELLQRVASAPAIQFNLTPAFTDYMLRQGVSEGVIKAMAARAAGVAAPRSLNAPATNPAVRAAPADQITMPTEIGVYYRDGAGQWRLVSPEPINWQTGGVIKELSTAYIVKGDVNGRLNKPSSPTKITTPTELYVYCPEGSGITEYQLLKFRTHSDSREFRSVTGGVFHVSGGAKRDTLDFESAQIGDRAYIVKLGGAIGAGEYGILPPGGSTDGRNASAQLGRIYTFSVK